MTTESRHTWQHEGTLMTDVTRLTRHEAAARLEVSEATVDRMIKRGSLETEKEAHGSRYKVWVLMEPDEAGVDTGDKAGRHNAERLVETSLYTGDKAERTVEGHVYTNGYEDGALKTERDGLTSLVGYLQNQLKDSEWRYHELMEQLKVSQENVAILTKALPSADSGTPSQRRRWWPFRRGKR